MKRIGHPFGVVVKKETIPYVFCRLKFRKGNYMGMCLKTFSRSQIFSGKQREAGGLEKYASLILSEQEQRRNKKNKGK